MSLSALNETGQPVDWWFIYKVPKLDAIQDSDACSGYEYVYYDSEIDSSTSVRDRKVTKSDRRLDGDDGAMAKTLKSVLEPASGSIGRILYNDEYPQSVGKDDNGSLGHTKGVIGFDTSDGSAFWLLHSWPKYVDPATSKAPTPMYGQTFLCLSISLETASKLATQMANHQEPQTFGFVKGRLPDDHPLVALSQPLDPNAEGDSDSQDLMTQGGMSFKVIAKNRKWGKDFWNDLVGPTLGVDIVVETWIRGKIAPQLDSDGIHKTFDIKYINLASLGWHVAWPESHDHAKWAISTSGDWICVGDINRMVSQEKRGGGTIAFQNEILWNALGRTSLIIAPPGVNRLDARNTVHDTHLSSPTGPEASPTGPDASPDDPQS